MDLNHLYDLRASAWEAAKAALNAGDDVAYKRATAEVDATTEKIERAEDRAENTLLPIDVPNARVNPGFSDGDRGSGDLAFERYLRTGHGGESRAQGTSPDSAGGYTVPSFTADSVHEIVKSTAAVVREANVITTSQGGTLTLPTVDDTANKGVILAENTQVSEGDIEFGGVDVGAFTYNSKLVRVSLQLLQDANVNVESLVVKLLGGRIGRGLNEHLTVGTGTSEPSGVVPGAGDSGVGTLDFDGLIDLQASIDAAYLPNAKFMMARSTEALLRKIKDTTDQYIWAPAVAAGQANTIFGYPIVVNDDVPAAGTGNRSVLFGDFAQAYTVRRTRDVTILRLAERYADYLQVGFLAFARYDGATVDPTAVKAIVQA